MFGLGGGLDPKKIKAVMKQMGINQEDVDAKRVVIERDDGRIIIENPSVQKIIVQGQASFQIAGDIKEEEGGIREEDVKLVMEKTGKNEKEARKALENANGDIAEAILSLGS